MSKQTGTESDWLTHFPVTFFATIMGLSGLALATHAAETAWRIPPIPSVLLLLATIAGYVVVAALYLCKMRRHPAAVAAEWNHPVKRAFFPAISISLLLIGTALIPVLPALAKGIWLIGMALQLVLTLAVLSAWIGQKPFQPMHISPAWFIPAVGNVIVPVGGVQLGFVEMSWFFFSAGLIFWFVLLTLVMNRLIFHDPLPGKLLPTLAILIAPPAVAFLAWLQLNSGEVDAFARILLNITYMFGMLVAVQALRFGGVPFALSWWALSFPVAAASVATFRFAALTGSGFHSFLSVVLYMLLLIIMTTLIARTFVGLRRNEICVPE